MQGSPIPPFRALADPDSTREVLQFASRLARMGLWTLHLPEGRVIWSPELEEVFGIPSGSFEGTREAFRARVHPLDLPRLAYAIDESLASGQEYAVIFRFRHASGEWRWMEARGLPTFNEAGDAVRIDGVGIDVTERTLAEHARSRLAAIVESSSDAIVGKTLDGIVTSWNAGATQLLGYSAEEMIGQPVARLIPAELLDEEEKILARLVRGERIERYESRRISRAGTVLDVSLTLSPIRDVTGAIIGASIIARDIRELRRAIAEREQLLLSERNARAEAARLSHLKDEFLATLSHELRSPLSAIIGWVNLLRRRSNQTEAELKAALETIHRNAQAQRQLIDDLLDMNRIVSGKIRLQAAAVDLGELLQDAADGIRPTAVAKQIQVDVAVEADGAIVAGDPARLQQVLWNLLTNAVKFTPQGGQVQLRLVRDGEYARIEVADSGIGIDPSFAPHVFERFSQAEGAASRSSGGLGLGLSIVRNLVELHGGSVSAHSEGPSRGTTFTVRLPLLQQPSALALPGGQAGVFLPDHDLLPKLQDAVVLIVDDELAERALLERLLKETGARVMAAQDAFEALEILQRETVDLILSDLGMPGLDGFEFLRRVRSLEDPHARSIPAIAVSAYAREEDRVRSHAAGFQQHLCKPYSFAELSAALAAMLGRPRPEASNSPAADRLPVAPSLWRVADDRDYP